MEVPFPAKLDIIPVNDQKEAPPFQSFSSIAHLPITTMFREIFRMLSDRFATHKAPSAPPETAFVAMKQPSAPPMPQSSSPMPAPSAPPLAMLPGGLVRPALPAAPNLPIPMAAAQPAQANPTLLKPNVPILNPPPPANNQVQLPNPNIGKSALPTAVATEQNTTTSSPFTSSSPPNLNPLPSPAVSHPLPPNTSVPDKPHEEQQAALQPNPPSASKTETMATESRPTTPNEPASLNFSTTPATTPPSTQAVPRPPDAARNEPGSFTTPPETAKREVPPAAPQATPSQPTAMKNESAPPTAPQTHEGSPAQTVVNNAPSLPVLPNAPAPTTALPREFHPNGQVNTGAPQTAPSQPPAAPAANQRAMNPNPLNTAPQAKSFPQANPSLPSSSAATGFTPPSEGAKGAPTAQPTPAPSSPQAPVNAPPVNPPPKAAVPPEALPGFAPPPGSPQKQEGSSNPKGNAAVPYSSPSAITKSPPSNSSGSVGHPEESNGVEDDEEDEEGDEEEEEEEDEEAEAFS